MPDPFQATFDPSTFTGVGAAIAVVPVAGAAITTSVSGCQPLQDDSVEGPHSFEVMLGSVPAEFSGAVTLDPTPLNVTIIDDDSKCVILPSNSFGHINSYLKYHCYLNKILTYSSYFLKIYPQVLSISNLPYFSK